MSQSFSPLPTSSLISATPLATVSTSLLSTVPAVPLSQTVVATSMTQSASMVMTGISRLNQVSSTIAAGAHSITLSNTDDTPSVPLPVLIAVPAGVLVLVSVIFIVIVLCCVRCRRRRKYTIKTAGVNRLNDHHDGGKCGLMHTGTDTGGG